MPFKTYFKPEALAAYHRVIPMEDFMAELADDVWPQDKGRAAFCYAHRHGKAAESCNAKEGNPFGPFWDTFAIDFDSFTCDDFPKPYILLGMIWLVFSL